MNGTPRFQKGSLTLQKNKTAPATWCFRFYEELAGRRIYRNQRIGSVKELPTRRDAEKADLNFRIKINAEVRTPESVADLINHYQKHELIEASGKRSSTRAIYGIILERHVLPRWGSVRLDGMKTVDVELWLRSLDYQPVPLHPHVAAALEEWKGVTLYPGATGTQRMSIRQFIERAFFLALGRLSYSTGEFERRATRPGCWRKYIPDRQYSESWRDLCSTCGADPCMGRYGSRYNAPAE